EGHAGLSVPEQAGDLFRRFDDELRGLGLSLDNTVRSRLWGRDRAARDDGSRERVATLIGAARSASSSYISPSHFDSDGSVALDLWAMRPSHPSMAKPPTEYEPASVPLRYRAWPGLGVLSRATVAH